MTFYNRASELDTINRSLSSTQAELVIVYGRRGIGGLRHAIEMSQKDLHPVISPWRLCFSRSGFHPDLIAEASHSENRIILIDPDRLYS